MPEDPATASVPSAHMLAHERRWVRTDVILLLLAAGLLVWITGEVLLLVFAGILLAVGLDGLACWIARYTPLSRGWALSLVLVLILVLLALVGYLVVPQFLAQLDELWSMLVDFINARLGDWMEFAWVEQLVGAEPELDQMAEAAGKAAEQLAAAILTLVSIGAGMIILLTISLFAVADPQLYRNGLLSLFPAEPRRRLDEALSAIAQSLRWWFVAQLVSMALLGVTVSLGLLALGIELWLGLGIITALLTFVPFLGPIIAAVPILIVGFTAGTQTGLIVLVGYLVIQNIEGNIVVPLIQQKAVELAPAFFIGMQVLMTLLFGVVGFILAAPLTVVGMVAVKKLWIQDVLGEEVSV